MARWPRALAAGLVLLPLAACGPTMYSGHTIQQALAPVANGPITILQESPTVFKQLSVVIYTTASDPNQTHVAVVRRELWLWLADWAATLTYWQRSRPCPPNTTLDTVDFIQPSEMKPPVLLAVGKVAGPEIPSAVRVYVSTLHGGRPDQTYSRQISVVPGQAFWVVTFPFQVDGPMRATALAADGREIPSCT